MPIILLDPEYMTRRIGMSAYVARQPIFDRVVGTFGYELVFDTRVLAGGDPRPSFVHEWGRSFAAAQNDEENCG